MISQKDCKLLMIKKSNDRTMLMGKLMNRLFLFVVVPVIGLQVPAFGQ